MSTWHKEDFTDSMENNFYLVDTLLHTSINYGLYNNPVYFLDTKKGDRITKPDEEVYGWHKMLYKGDNKDADRAALLKLLKDRDKIPYYFDCYSYFPLKSAWVTADNKLEFVGLSLAYSLSEKFLDYQGEQYGTCMERTYMQVYSGISNYNVKSCDTKLYMFSVGSDDFDNAITVVATEDDIKQCLESDTKELRAFGLLDDDLVDDAYFRKFKTVKILMDNQEALDKVKSLVDNNKELKPGYLNTDDDIVIEVSKCKIDMQA